MENCLTKYILHSKRNQLEQNCSELYNINLKLPQGLNKLNIKNKNLKINQPKSLTSNTVTASFFFPKLLCMYKASYKTSPFRRKKKVLFQKIIQWTSS